MISEAGDAQEALEHAQALMPDLSLMDIYMPGMSGSEVTRRIMEVRKLDCQGKNIKDIGAALAIAESSVKSYLKIIPEKPHLENRVQAATFPLPEGPAGETPGQAD